LKDFMGAYGKIGGIGAAAGFLLSMLVGLFSGNPFATIVLRALLFALLFGGLGIGARIVVGRFLPELESASGSGREPEARKVDIVLPEENPHVDPQGVRVAEAGGDGGAEAKGPMESGASGDEGNAETGSSDLPPPDAEDMDEVQEAPETESPEPVTAAEPERPRGAGPLPTLDSLGSGSSPMGSSGMGTAMGRAKANAGAMGDLGGEDPATIARAIRTVLKKDEKG